MTPKAVKITRDGTAYFCGYCPVTDDLKKWLVDYETSHEVITVACEKHKTEYLKKLANAPKVEPYIQTPTSPKFRLITDEDINTMQDWLERNK